jgi:hypothetical protein
MNVTFRPELPQRIFWGIAIIVFGLRMIGTLVEGPSDGTAVGIMLMCAAYVAWTVRNLFMRVVASESGVRIVGLFSDRTYPWSSIARFEGPPQSKYIRLVTETGDRRRLPGLHQSIVEQIQNRPNQTEDVFESLQRLLDVARERRQATTKEPG